MVLPTYEHFIHCLNITGGVSRETNVLSKYGKTIQMMILTRVNGYYSPFIPSTLGQEEDQAETGDVFSLAEENFFRHRLKTLYPKIDEQGVKSAIGFLATQKLVNCPCDVHTEERGYEWIVFRRQPDRKMDSSENDSELDYTLDEISYDDVFFSAEAEEAILNPTTNEQSNAPESEKTLKKKGSSTDGSDGKREMAKPQMSDLPHDSSLHSRDENSTTSQQTDQKKERKNKRKKNKVEETEGSPMSLDEMNGPEEKEIPKKRKGFLYYPLLTYKRDLDKTFLLQVL